MVKLCCPFHFFGLPLHRQKRRSDSQLRLIHVIVVFLVLVFSYLVFDLVDISIFLAFNGINIKEKDSLGYLLHNEGKTDCIRIIEKKRKTALEASPRSPCGLPFFSCTWGLTPR